MTTIIASNSPAYQAGYNKIDTGDDYLDNLVAEIYDYYTYLLEMEGDKEAEGYLKDEKIKHKKIIEDNGDYKKWEKALNKATELFKTKLSKESSMKFKIKRLARRIIRKAMPLRTEDPTIRERSIVMDAMKNYFGIEKTKHPVWSEYLTMREGSANKFHMFVVFQDGINIKRLMHTEE